MWPFCRLLRCWMAFRFRLVTSILTLLCRALTFGISFHFQGVVHEPGFSGWFTLLVLHASTCLAVLSSENTGSPYLDAGTACARGECDRILSRWSLSGGVRQNVDQLEPQYLAVGTVGFYRWVAESCVVRTVSELEYWSRLPSMRFDAGRCHCTTGRFGHLTVLCPWGAFVMATGEICSGS